MDFDKSARTWDKEHRVIRAKEIADEIIQGLNFPEGANAMEFGCGTGLVSFNLKDKFESITLVDSSQGMIDVLNEKITAENITNLFPHFLDLTKEDKLKGKFDFIYSSMALHHIKDIRSILQNLYNMLNKNGVISLVDLDKEDGSFHSEFPDFDGHNGFDRDELVDLLIEIGFEIIEAKTVCILKRKISEEDKEFTLFNIKAIKYRGE